MGIDGIRCERVDSVFFVFFSFPCISFLGGCVIQVLVRAYLCSYV